MKSIEIEDFAKSFGVTVNDLSQVTLKEINKHNFSYKQVAGEALEKLMLQILKKIELDNQVISEKKRAEVWENGWNESLNQYLEGEFDNDIVRPMFIRKDLPLRWNQSYIIAEDPWFEMNFVEVMKTHIFQHYFSNVDTIFEFGSGTGHNLVTADNVLNNVELIGSDFAPSAVDLINKIGKKRGGRLRAELFDMMHPNKNLVIGKSSGIFISGALEQLAGEIDPMFQYLMEQDFKICVLVEPTTELYNDNILSDYLAKIFQSQRGYTSNLLKKLNLLAETKKIKLKKIQRLKFGSMMMEGYNLFVWSKLP